MTDKARASRGLTDGLAAMDSDDLDRLEEMSRLASITRLMDSQADLDVWEDDEIGLMHGVFTRARPDDVKSRKRAKREARNV